MLLAAGRGVHRGARGDRWWAKGDYKYGDMELMLLIETQRRLVEGAANPDRLGFNPIGEIDLAAARCDSGS